MTVIKKISKYLDPYLGDIRTALISSINVNTRDLNHVDSVLILTGLGGIMLISITWFIVMKNLEWVWILFVLMLNEIFNLTVSICRKISIKNLTSTNQIKTSLKKVKLSRLITSRILLLLFYITLPSSKAVEEWIFFPLDLILTCWIVSVWIFDASLTLEGKEFSFRYSYFRDRFLYYCVYGIPTGVCFYFKMYIAMSIFHMINLYSDKVVKQMDKPAYARWIPHQNKKISTDFEEWLEKGITWIIDKMI